jgi:hypothetical protein
MAEIKQLQTDLGYVRDVVGRSGKSPSPAAIYLFWAPVILVGFALVDFAPRYVGLYWMIAGPVGAVVSAILGWRHSVKCGQLSRETGTRHALHWCGMLAVIFLAALLGITGGVTWDMASKIILLIVGFGYFLAGVHLDQPIMWIGLLLFAGYIALFFVTAYGWTIVGVIVAAAMTAAALMGGRKRAASGR